MTASILFYVLLTALALTGTQYALLHAVELTLNAWRAR